MKEGHDVERVTVWSDVAKDMMSAMVKLATEINEPDIGQPPAERLAFPADLVWDVLPGAKKCLWLTSVQHISSSSLLDPLPCAHFLVFFSSSHASVVCLSPCGIVVATLAVVVELVLRVSASLRFTISSLIWAHVLTLFQCLTVSRSFDGTELVGDCLLVGVNKVWSNF